ncbi:MAG: ABC transporter ATP-binding protein, partial [Chlorobiaceae bacterium]|nr:ABC transporter ATP-binding protein [Chlorobiaceae bacterium]
DEPTNDLDIPTLRVLEDYLDSYQGCLMVVSHDRYFLDRTVEYIFAFEENGLIRRYPGNYTVYLDMKAALAVKEKDEKKSGAKEQQKILPAVSVKPKQSRLTSKEKRELETLEQSIHDAEIRQTEIAVRLASAGSDFELQQKLGSELHALQQQLEKEMARWSKLAEMA